MSAYKEFSHALAQDRNAALKEAVIGKPEMELFKKMPYEKYENFVREVGDLMSSYNKTKSPEVFAEALIQKNNAKQFQSLIRQIGTDNPMVNEIKSAWIYKIMDSATNPTSGILNARKMIEEMGSYGKSTVDSILSKSEQRQLEFVARRFEKISKAGITPEESTSALKDLLGVVGHPIVSLGNLIFKFFKGDAKAIDYLSDKGWFQAIKTLPIEKQAQALDARRNFLSAVSGAKRVEMNGKSFYVIPPVRKDLTAGGVRSLVRQGVDQSVDPFDKQKEAK